MNNYFPKNYLTNWFAYKYFVISIIIPPTPDKKQQYNSGGGGGSYLLPGEKLFPDEVMPKEFEIVQKKLKEELPDVLKEIQDSIDDEEEAIVLIQIISELPHSFIERKFFKIKRDNDVIELINFIADKTK